jgi:predicted DNA-binding protein
MSDDDNMETVGVRMPPATIARLRKIADADGRTVSNLVRKWVEDRLEHGR